MLKNLKQKHNKIECFWKNLPKTKNQSDFHVLWKLGFLFGRTSIKMWMIFMILRSQDPWKNLKKNAINFHILKSPVSLKKPQNKFKIIFYKLVAHQIFLNKEPQAFSDVKSGVRAKLNKNEITTPKHEMKIGILLG